MHAHISASYNYACIILIVLSIHAKLMHNYVYVIIRLHGPNPSPYPNLPPSYSSSSMYESVAKYNHVPTSSKHGIQLRDF